MNRFFANKTTHTLGLASSVCKPKPIWRGIIPLEILLLFFFTLKVRMPSSQQVNIDWDKALFVISLYRFSIAIEIDADLRLVQPSASIV